MKLLSFFVFVCILIDWFIHLFFPPLFFRAQEMSRSDGWVQSNYQTLNVSDNMYCKTDWDEQ